MNTPRQAPIFLERSGYRQRRIRDFARLLPIIGVILVLMPLLWPGGAQSDHGTADALLYLFFVWLVLVAVAVAVSRKLRDGMTPTEGASDFSTQTAPKSHQERP
ncbi:hypothetical protein [Aestuariibius sp. HNIBRBA575]|uniref:hypothetical protein n=1 Tax=Aestuariibius sp. HNIBRBA575 TaxID=3233343 RepID=UPI0034A3663E